MMTDTFSLFPTGSEKIKILGTIPVADRDPYWQSALDDLLRGEKAPDGYNVSVKSVPATFNLMPISRSIVFDKGQEDDVEIVFNGVGFFTFEKGEGNVPTVIRHGISSNETFAAYQDTTIAAKYGMKEAIPWGTAIVTKEGTVLHLASPELLGTFNVETLSEKIASTEYVEGIVKKSGLRIAIPHFVAASVYGSDETKVAGGVYIRPKILTDILVVEKGLSRSMIMTLRHEHYRAIRELMDAHVLNPQLHFGNRGWAIQNDGIVAYIADWEDMMNTNDYDTQVAVPLELQGFVQVRVTALEKARIFALRKAIGQDVSNVMIEPKKVQHWNALIEKDIVLGIASGFYRERDLGAVQERLAADIKSAEIELGVSYQSLLKRFATSLQGLATGTAKIGVGEIAVYYRLHQLYESELSTFLALVLVKSVAGEVAKKKRKRR